jgi:8-amino-7-oxononanoate synthase
MPNFDESIASDLEALRASGLWRELRTVDSPQGREISIGGEHFLNFSSNDYLGLANSEGLKEASVKALQDFGSGSGASRLICGSLKPHSDLEQRLAEFKGTEAALSYSSGFLASFGSIQALVGPNDISVIDKLVHASIVDGVRLSGAKMRIFKHNDLNSLSEILLWADRQPKGRVLIITESIFSMDGDRAPLREIVELKEKHGAWLMVDEAHGTGLYGQHRRGVIEELGLSERVEVQMGTLGKAIGAAGGYICGSRNLIDYLINKARSFIFSTAPVPASAAAACAGIDMVRSKDGERRCGRLWLRVRQLQEEMTGISQTTQSLSAINPIIIGSEQMAVDASALLRQNHCFVPAIRYPTVARGTARLRLTLSADHTKNDVQLVAGELRELRRLVGSFKPTIEK